MDLTIFEPVLTVVEEKQVRNVLLPGGHLGPHCTLAVANPFQSGHERL